MLTAPETKPIPVRPDQRNLIGHTHVTRPGTMADTHVVVFEYPDCIRTFDGDVWKVLPKVI